MGSARKLTTWNGSLPGMEVKLISSAAHSRCHSLLPSNLPKLILLETVLILSSHPAQAC